MLPLSKVQEIKRLLDEGSLSQRRIAKQLEVSRGIVAAIASGRRGLHGRESNQADDTPELGPPERCPSCGHLVYLPCVFCRAKEYAARKRQQEELRSGGERHTPTRVHGKRG